MLAQALSIAALVPPLGVTAVIIMVPVFISLALFIRYGTETRGLDLRHLESRPSGVATSELASSTLENA